MIFDKVNMKIQAFETDLEDFEAIRTEEDVEIADNELMAPSKMPIQPVKDEQVLSDDDQVESFDILDDDVDAEEDNDNEVDSNDEKTQTKPVKLDSENAEEKNENSIEETRTEVEDIGTVEDEVDAVDEIKDAGYIDCSAENGPEDGSEDEAEDVTEAAFEIVININDEVNMREGDVDADFECVSEIVAEKALEQNSKSIPEFASKDQLEDKPNVFNDDLNEDQVQGVEIEIESSDLKSDKKCDLSSMVSSVGDSGRASFSPGTASELCEMEEEAAFYSNEEDFEDLVQQRID